MRHLVPMMKYIWKHDLCSILKYGVFLNVFLFQYAYLKTTIWWGFAFDVGLFMAGKC